MFTMEYGMQDADSELQNFRMITAEGGKVFELLAACAQVRVRRAFIRGRLNDECCTENGRGQETL